MPYLVNEEKLVKVLSGEGAIATNDLFEDAVFVKAEDWAYEKEWRLVGGWDKTAEEEHTRLKINPDCGAFSFIIGKDFGITRKKACSDVLDWLPPERKPFFLVADSIFGFHPKALFWKTKDGSCYALIGSSNLTEGGLNSNYEANAFQKITTSEFTSVMQWIDTIREKSVPVTRRWLDTYREAPTARGRKKGSSATVSSPTTAVQLPSVVGSAGMVRERREKKRLFAKIRPQLVSAICRCASGKISNERFFEVLQRTWGEGPRVQGWGWEVLGRHSDFRPLCRAILTIVDAKHSDRDVHVKASNSAQISTDSDIFR